MGDLKPLGSEKLNGDEKLKRILHLTYYNNPKKTINESKAELVRESASGGVFAIVKEKDGYYVKKGLNENTLDYIGGMFMKNKNKFSSYAEALKRLELLSGQENINEATKYVLKQKTSAPPVSDAPVSEPTEPAPSEPQTDTPPDLGIPDDVSGEPSPDGMSGEEGGEAKRSDYMAEIQKYAGKLGQELRDQKERLEGDDIKYVLNMIISAVDLDKLELEDLEEIGRKFEREEEEMDNDEPILPEPSSDEEPSSEEPPSDEDLGETMKKLSDFVKSTAPTDKHEINLSDYADLGNVEEDEIKELDLDEIQKEISNSINQTLSKYFK